MFRQTEASCIRTRLRFQSHPYLEVEYEKLTAENNETITGIQEFLGVSSCALSTELVRMNPWPAK
jgi:hypothetical protein